jgi:hypothetical protein
MDLHHSEHSRDPSVGASAGAGHRIAISLLTARANEANIGGVATWSARLASRLRRSNHTWRLHTIVMPVEPGAEMPSALAGEPDVTMVPWPESGDLLELLEATRVAVIARDPSVLLPGNSDLCQMVAQQVRDATAQSERPVRVIVSAQTDEAANRTLLERYQPSDGGFGVSVPCEEWLRGILRVHAPQRTLPVELIPAGADVAAQPRTATSGGPLQLAWLGRLEQSQKRVMDLPLLASALRDRGVDFVLHIAGDGEMRGPLSTVLASQRLLPYQGGPVRFHGPLDAVRVRELLEACDVLVLTSAAEGTSLSMQEAMGLGVVPAVTQIPGIEHWITDGRNGVVAPVGRPEVLAGCIAALAADRAALAGMGRAAWETACRHFAPAATDDRYVSLFERVVALPVDSGKSRLLGLRRLNAAAAATAASHALAHWPRCTFTDEAAARAVEICSRWATQAGVRIAASPEAAIGGDCVIFDPTRLPPTPRLVCTLLARGVIPVVPHALMDHRPCERAQGVLNDLVRAGHRRIALYGAGAHTRTLCGGLNLAAGGEFPVVGIIDDAAAPADAAGGRGTKIAGLPVVHPDRASDDLAPDAIVLSSDRHEPSLTDSAQRFRRAGIPVRSIYDPSLEHGRAEAADRRVA